MKKIVKWFFNVFMCHILYRVKFVNIENVNKFNKCLICPNHSCKFDSNWIYAKTDDIYIMAKSELFENKLNAKLLRSFDVFPIKRGGHDTSSILHAINIFKNVNKRKLLIFPEGEKVRKNEKRGVAKVGPVYIASKANVPIIPVYLTKNPKLFSRVYVIFGEPVYYDKNIIKDKNRLKEETSKLLDTIYGLKDLNVSKK